MSAAFKSITREQRNQLLDRAAGKNIDTFGRYFVTDKDGKTVV